MKRALFFFFFPPAVRCKSFKMHKLMVKKIKTYIIRATRYPGCVVFIFESSSLVGYDCQYRDDGVDESIINKIRNIKIYLFYNIRI